MGILGVIELFLGFIALASPWIVGASFIWVIGIMLMILAVVRLVQVFTVPSSRWWNLVTAILYGIAGWFLFRDPNISLAITTLIIGWGLVIAAVFQGAIWLQTRSLPASGWQLRPPLIPTTAMTLTQEETERYARHLSLPELGEQGQQKLKRAHVALTGLGGLGSPAALYLAAAGVGRLTLIDPDEVCLSNLQRQILHATDAAGTAKTASAARRLYALNPSVHINTVHRRLTPDNAVSLLEGCDLVLDASDNYAARFAMADAACALRLPLVHGAVKGFIGQVAVFAPHQGTACYRCLFPADTPMQEKDTASAAGILGAHAGIIGCIQAMETLKYLAGIPSPLVGAMLSADTRRMRFTTIPLAANPACRCRKNGDRGAAMKN